MSGFPAGTVVQVEEKEEADFDFWKILKEINYEGDEKVYKVDVGEFTDFASVPKFLVWFLPRYGKYTKAAILHDHLWGKEISDKLSYLQADNIFRQAMFELDVSLLQRWLMWTAVRLDACFKQNGWAGAWKELPRFLMLLIFGLVMVGIPCIPVLITRVLFHLLELVIYHLLETRNKLQTKRGVIPPKVNKPELSWKM